MKNKMEKLAMMRKSKKITQGQLAKTLGWGSDTISQYERGVRQPNLEKLQKIAKALDCAVSDII